MTTGPICTNGHLMIAGFSFCPACGASEREATAPAAEPSTIAPEQPPLQPPKSERTPPTEHPGSTAQRARWLVVGLAVTLVAVLAAATVLVTRGGRDKTKVASQLVATTRVTDRRAAPPTSDADPTTGPSGPETSVVLTSVGPATNATLIHAAEIISDRLHAYGGAGSGADANVQGDSIIVRYRGQGADRAVALASIPGVLRMRPVLNEGAPGYAVPSSGEDRPEATVILPELRDGVTVVLYELGSSLADGTIIETAEAEPPGNGDDWKVAFKMTPKGSQAFDHIAKACYPPDPAACPTGRLAIVFDDKVLSAPSINTAAFGGKAEISGRFSETEAKELALVLRTGALPVAFRVSSTQSSP